MNIFWNTRSKTKLRLLVTLLVQIGAILVASQKVLSADQYAFEKPSLETLREMVVKNEDLSSLIKMNFQERHTRSGPPRDTNSGNSAGRRRPGTPYTHHNGIWAQEGIKQYSHNDFYAQDKKAQSSVQTIDGEVMMWGKMPDLMQGKIDRINRFNWVDASPIFLGFRPFDGKHLLSELLLSVNASIHDDTEMIEGRETYVVDVKVPTNKAAFFGKIWIDSERGMPLHLEYYDKDPSNDQARLICRVESIKLHQLPNNGWIPVEGNRIIYFNNGRVVSEQIVVDIDSVTIRREDIPESLFTIKFAQNAKIYNAITNSFMDQGIDSDQMLEKLGNEALGDPLAENNTTTLSEQEPTTQPAQSQSTKNLPPTQEIMDGEKQIEPAGQDTKKLPGETTLDTQSYTITWIFFFALLSICALAILVWIIRSRYKSINTEVTK